MRKFRGQTNKACFTLNNYDDEELLKVTRYLDNEKRLAYAIIGEECGESGTLHLQGYIRFNKKEFKCRKGTMGFWKAIPGLWRAHFEISKGSDQDNFDYCSKGKMELVSVAPRAKGPRRFKKKYPRSKS